MGDGLGSQRNHVDRLRGRGARRFRRGRSRRDFPPSRRCGRVRRDRYHRGDRMSELRVVAVTVKDVLGAREFAMQPGKVTTLRGKNGSGKSTALAAVQAALGGGNLAKMARVGAPGEKVEPEVVLVIE